MMENFGVHRPKIITKKHICYEQLNISVTYMYIQYICMIPIYILYMRAFTYTSIYRVAIKSRTKFSLAYVQALGIDRSLDFMTEHYLVQMTEC